MFAFTLTARTAVLVVFAVAVAGKLRHRDAYREFLAALVAARLLPGGLRRAAAVGMLVAEAAVAVLAASPLPALPGLLLAAVLLLAFAAVTLVAIRRGRRVACACFGATATPLGPAHVARDVLLAVLALAGAAAPAAARSGWPGTGGSTVPALFLGMALAAVAIRFDDVVALFGGTTNAKEDRVVEDPEYRMEAGR